MAYNETKAMMAWRTFAARVFFVLIFWCSSVIAAEDVPGYSDDLWGPLSKHRIGRGECPYIQGRYVRMGDEYTVQNRNNSKREESSKTSDFLIYWHPRAVSSSLVQPIPSELGGKPLGGEEFFVLQSSTDRIQLLREVGGVVEAVTFERSLGDFLCTDNWIILKEGGRRAYTEGGLVDSRLIIGISSLESGALLYSRHSILDRRSLLLFSERVHTRTLIRFPKSNK